MKQKNTPQAIEPIRFKLWQRQPLDWCEIEIIDEALKKQISYVPKKCEIKSQNPDLYFCKCGETYYHDEYNRCPECGQRLCWEE